MDGGTLRHLAISLLLLLPSSLALAADIVLPVQGYLTDSSDLPIDGVLEVTFRLYPDASSTGPLYQETLDIAFDNGAFTAYIGEMGGLDSAVFSLDQDVFLGIRVAADNEMSPLRVGWAPLAAYAAHAADAETLDGFGSADFLGSDYSPDWTDITNRPAGLDDGDDVGNFTAGDGILITGTEIAADIGWVESTAQGVCFDTEDELTALLDDNYLDIDWRPDWTDIDNIPPGIGSGGGTTYSAGLGLELSGTTFEADRNIIEQWARGVCFDTSSELTAELDDEYLDIDWRPDWTDIEGIPADLLDGDNTGDFSAGNGIVIAGDTISADDSYIDARAAAVCYDTEAELTALLDDNYLGIGYAPDWTAISGKPAGFADDIDNDSFAAMSCPSGQAIVSIGDAWSCAPIASTWGALGGVPAGFSDNVDNDTLASTGCPEGQILIYTSGSWQCGVLPVGGGTMTPQEIADALSGVDVELGTGSTIGGSTFSTYGDADAISAVTDAFPELAPYSRDPLLQMGLQPEGCRHLNNGYGHITVFPTVFDEDPIFLTAIDETIENSGASYTNFKQVGPGRALMTCNARADATTWLAIEPGNHTIDGKQVQAGKLSAARQNDTIFFNPLFTEPPVVFLLAGKGNAWVRVIGSNGVSTGGFQVYVNTNDKELHWVAFEAGEYDYGRYHFEVGTVASPVNNGTYNLGATFHQYPSMLYGIIDTNNSNAHYVRSSGISKSSFSIYIDSNSAEILSYLAFEERR